jgi:osmotically-inducible protein OsmY
VLRLFPLLAIAALTLAGCAAHDAAFGGSWTDDALATRVKTAIAADVGPATASAIAVETRGGVVRLSGMVYSPDEAQRALDAATSVEGVQEVHPDLRLKPLPSP